MEKIIKIENLSKHYKMYRSKIHRMIELIFPWIKKHYLFNALNDINLELSKGEVLGILGKNGAGKSTLLKLITGVASATSGKIAITGRISSLLELGTAFNPELTGYENIYQHGQIMGLSNKQIKAVEQEIIEFADIGEHLNQPVKTYSSGMFARLAFSCAINVDPDILIVDEVLSVGDLSFQLKCFKKFEQFKSAGKTIIFVTHNVGDVLKNCTRAIILDKGQKIFDGNTKDGIEAYKKLIVGFLDIEEEQDKPESIDKTISYGNKEAEIIEYGIYNKNGEKITLIENDEEITVKMKVKFKSDIDDPIFAFSFKDFNGIEYCGTNTLINGVETGNFIKGDTAEITFTQKIPIQIGQYAISFGCTKFNASGDLVVYDRKYDAFLVEVISRTELGGFFKLDTKINVYKK